MATAVTADFWPLLPISHAWPIDLDGLGAVTAGDGHPIENNVAIATSVE